MEDIIFDGSSTLPLTYVVRHPEWRYVFADTELWADGFYHPIYAPYCAFEIAPNPILTFPLDTFDEF